MKVAVGSVLATWFGCGWFPYGPGTIGSAAAVWIAWLLAGWADWSPLAIALLGVLITPIGIWASEVEASRSGRKDPGQVVIDEVAGQWLAVAGAGSVLDWPHLLAAFGLFRLFDIWKPWPVRRLESLPGGFGIMADDLMAGVYAALVLLLTGWLNL